jgi:hypothetical protein
LTFAFCEKRLQTCDLAKAIKQIDNLLRSVEQVIIAAAVVAALFESLASCRHSANVDGRTAVGSRCDVSQFQNETAL